MDSPCVKVEREPFSCAGLGIRGETACRLLILLYVRQRTQASNPGCYGKILALRSYGCQEWESTSTTGEIRWLPVLQQSAIPKVGLQKPAVRLLRDLRLNLRVSLPGLRMTKYLG